MITEKYNETNGIKIFHTNIDHDDYNAKGLDSLYNAEEKHFWFISRKEFIFQSIEKHVKKTDNIIEIGAGTGNVSRYLNKQGYTSISVGEMHLKGLKYAKSYGIEQCYQFDLLKTPFQNEFDTVCMFDVLEHIDDDDLALQNIHKTLNKTGKIVLTVPSHQWLWSREDTIASHKRRYTKNELIEKLQENGFEIITAKYFFISIIPLLYLRTFLSRDNDSIIQNHEYDSEISIHPILNTILLSISRFENKINNFLPNIFGGSLFIIASKL